MCEHVCAFVCLREGVRSVGFKDNLDFIFIAWIYVPELLL